MKKPREGMYVIERAFFLLLRLCCTHTLQLREVVSSKIHVIVNNNNSTKTDKELFAQKPRERCTHYTVEDEKYTHR